MDVANYMLTANKNTLTNRLDMVASNMANASTTGFQKEMMIVQSKKDNGGNKYVNDISIINDTTQGDISNTGRVLDLAIDGHNQYFSVMTNAGVRYTRNGSFQLDGENKLVTSSGYPVLSTDGAEIIIDPNASDVTILDTGSILVDSQNIGKIGVSEFEKEQHLSKVGNLMLKSDVLPSAATKIRIIQGAVESPNINPVQESGELIRINAALVETNNIHNSINKLRASLLESLSRSD